MQAVILAGGKGTRLKPFTNIIPKPLVPLGDQPILEIILKQLHHHGVNEVIIAVNHLSHLIKAFFGNGEDLGLSIRYSKEEKPLGTAAPLKQISGLDKTFLVLNGDLLTTINYKEMFQQHIKTNTDLLIGTYSKKVKIDLGVIESEGENFISYTEKPELKYDVSMGLYVMNREVLRHIPENQAYDMPDLVRKAHEEGDTVRCYKGDFEWLDIGRIEDYEMAVKLFKNDKNKYLSE